MVSRKKKTVQILDYGSGNLFSIQDALVRVSKGQIKVITSSQYDDRVDGLVLPGVGSFTSAQKILSKNRRAILKDLLENNMPILGICLGMQLMFEKSEEGPGEGLSLFPGEIRRFQNEPSIKVPHMGWNTINFSKKDTRKSSSLCKGLKDSEWVYYVHSYFPVPRDAGIVLAWTEYGNDRFPAIVERGKIFGTQFHPEKSHSTGSKLLSNFAKLIVSSRE